MAKSLFGEILSGFASIGGEVFRQATGTRTKPNKHRSDHHYYNKAQRETDRFFYEAKKRAFETAKNYEIARLRAKSKGWIK